MAGQSWTEALITSFQNIWLNIVNFVPTLIGALILLVVGLIVAWACRIVIERVVGFLKIDALLKKIGLAPLFERANLQINSGRFFGLLIYWFVVIVFILAITDILGLYGVSLFLREAVSYLPNIIVATLIMLATLVLANFLRSVVRSSVASAKLHNPKFLGSLTWWVIVVFGLLAALMQVGIAGVILNTIVTGVIAALALATGLAFGLGGKDYAAHLIEKFREQIEEK